MNIHIDILYIMVIFIYYIQCILYIVARPGTHNTFSRLHSYDESIFEKYEKKVFKFWKIYQKMLPNGLLTYKAHHLIHYGFLVQKMGPMYIHNCLRYERKHQTFKNFASCILNNICIDFSLAKYFWKTWNAEDLCIKDEFEVLDTYYKDELNEVLDASFHQFIDFNTDLTILTKCILDGVQFDIGDYFAINYEDTFVIVQCLQIFMQNSQVIIVSQLNYYEHELDTNIFKLSKTPTLISISPNKLYFPHSLLSAFYDGKLCIQNNFYFCD